MRNFNGLQKAMRRNSAWMARLGAVLAVLMWQQAPIAQTPWPGRGAGPMMEERRIVERFDKDGDRRLNRIEREAARDWLANQPRRRASWRAESSRWCHAPAPVRWT